MCVQEKTDNTGFIYGYTFIFYLCFHIVGNAVDHSGAVLFLVEVNAFGEKMPTRQEVIPSYFKIQNNTNYVVCVIYPKRFDSHLYIYGVFF